MPSKHQKAHGSEYRNQAHRVFTLDIDPMPMVKGIENIDRAIMYWNEAHRCDAPESVKEKIQVKMDLLR